MGDFSRKADGRRVFTSEFKRTTVERIRSGESTVAEVAREMDIQPTVIRRWIKLSEGGSTAAVEAGESVVPLSRVRDLEKQIKELQRLVGKQAMTIEILEAAREVVKKVHVCSKGPSGDGVADGCRLSSVAYRSSHSLSPAPAAYWVVLQAGRGSGDAAADYERGARTGELWGAARPCPGESGAPGMWRTSLQPQTDPSSHADQQAHPAGEDPKT